MEYGEVLVGFGVVSMGEECAGVGYGVLGMGAVEFTEGAVGPRVDFAVVVVGPGVK